MPELKQVKFRLILYLVEFKYSLNDIGRIFINLNFMKKFETPQFLEDEKLSDIFNEKAKNSLALFQTTKEVVELRDRAYTYYDKPRSIFSFL